MAKKANNYVTSLGEALKTFDLKILLKWVAKHNPHMYSSFSKSNKTVQMATMCKMIINRTDLLGTEAYEKARKWLSLNNMKGGIY